MFELRCPVRRRQARHWRRTSTSSPIVTAGAPPAWRRWASNTRGVTCRRRDDMSLLERVISRHVVLLVYDGFNLLDLSGPLQTFATANRLAENVSAEPPYRLTVASGPGGPISCGAGLSIDTVSVDALHGHPIDALLVSGGCRGDEFEHPLELEHWIARHAPRARRVCSVCTGAFVLAGAGLLR